MGKCCFFSFQMFPFMSRKLDSHNTPDPSPSLWSPCPWKGSVIYLVGRIGTVCWECLTQLFFLPLKNKPDQREHIFFSHVSNWVDKAVVFWGLILGSLNLQKYNQKMLSETFFWVVKVKFCSRNCMLLSYFPTSLMFGVW